MSRPRNEGTHGWQNARKRLRQIDADVERANDQIAVLDAEASDLRAFLAQCERYANETPADQLQPQAVGSAEQGDGAPSQGDGAPPSTLEPIASPCSAEGQSEIAERGPERVPQGEARASALPQVEPEETCIQGVSSGEAAPVHQRGPGMDAGSASTPARPDTYPAIPVFLCRPAPA